MDPTTVVTGAHGVPSLAFRIGIPHHTTCRSSRGAARATADGPNLHVEADIGTTHRLLLSRLGATFRSLGESTRRDEIAEHAVGGVEHRNHGAAQRVILGEMTAEQALLRSTTMRREHRHDHDVRVERAHRLHANELESQRPAGELLDCSERGISRDPQITEGARHAFGFAGHALALHPLELDFRPARTGRRAMENKVREAESFALQLRLADHRPGVLARR
jgi:hypothetical protein